MFGFQKKKKKTSGKQDSPENNQTTDKTNENAPVSEIKISPASQNSKTNRMDKLVMGAIVGVAVGSVIGISLAPKKIKNNPILLSDENKEKSPLKHKKSFFSFFKNLFLKKEKQSAPKEKILKKIPNEVD